MGSLNRSLLIQTPNEVFILLCRPQEGGGLSQASEVLLGYLLFLGIYPFVNLHLSLARNLIVRVVSPELNIVDRHVTLEACDLVQDSKVVLGFFWTESLFDSLSEYEVLDKVVLFFL